MSYLGKHEWEWIPKDQIIMATKCTNKDFDILKQAPFKAMVEVKRGEYRYIGNRATYLRRIVDAVKEAYPDYITAPEIGKRADLDSSPGGYITRYADLLPIETITEHEKYRGDVKLYRYVPDDQRSMLPTTQYISLKRRRQMSFKSSVLKVLKNHPGTWFSAQEIAARIGHSSGSSVISSLRYIAQAEPLVKVKIGTIPGGYKKRNYYSYNPKDRAYKPRETTSEVLA